MKRKFKTQSSNKNIFKRFMALVLGAFMFTITFALSGCESMFPMANDVDINLAGIKVLRRPEKYSHYDDDYDGRVGENGYYYTFAEDIFNTLYRTYGIVNNEYYSQPTAPGTSIFDALYNVMGGADVEGNENLGILVGLYNSSDDKIKYFYDAIRYQITNDETKDNGTSEDISDDYVEVAADTSLGWNWMYNYSEFSPIRDFDSNDDYISSFVYSQYFSVGTTHGNITGSEVKNNKTQYNLSIMDMYFSNFVLPDIYSTKISDSNFIYTLGYAIYCIVLGLTPNGAGWVGDTWQVEGYESAEVAFNTLKNTFQESGSYVGLTQRNKDQITTYILNNVIGERAVSASNHTELGYDLYYEDVVRAVVEYCGKLTKTGTAGGDSYAGDAFIASELVDFDQSMFFFEHEGDDPFAHILSCEYQSLIIMPGEDEEFVDISDIWLDFRYVAHDKDGNAIDNPDLYLDIRIVLRWWDGSHMHTCYKDIRLFNGVYDPGGESTAWFELDASVAAGEDFPESFGSVARISPFNCEDLVVPDDGEEPENISALTITGETPQRHYFEVVNSDSGFGSYGRLKAEKMGSNPFLEINFDIQKNNIETYRSYDFQVGFSKLEYDK